MATQALVRTSVQETLAAQLDDGKLPEVGQTLKRLEAHGYSRDAAKNMIGCVLALELRDSGAQAFDVAHYLDNLRRLPKLPGE